MSLAPLGAWISSHSCGPVFLITLLAVYGPGPIGLEWNLCLFTAIRAYHIMHLSWAVVEATPITKSHIFHFLFDSRRAALPQKHLNKIT